MAGNFGSDIAFWVDDDLSVGGLNSNGELGDGYLRFVNFGRFLKLPADVLTLRIGQFEPDLPFTQARSINISPYDIYTEANIGVPNNNNGLPSVNNVYQMLDAAQGIEFSGGHPYKGYHYSLAIVNQNTSGATSSATNVPSCRRSARAVLAFSLTRTSRISTPTSLTALISRRTRQAGTISRPLGRLARATTRISAWARSLSTANRRSASRVLNRTA